jgi:uncharacterized protein DUF2795
MTIREEAQTSRREDLSQGRGVRRQYTDKSGKSGHVSPAIVEKYLAGIRYPTEKKNLVAKAHDKDAPCDVMDLLSKLPDKTYRSPIDITKEMGKKE